MFEVGSNKVPSGSEYALGMIFDKEKAVGGMRNSIEEFGMLAGWGIDVDGGAFSRGAEHWFIVSVGANRDIGWVIIECGKLDGVGDWRGLTINRARKPSFVVQLDVEVLAKWVMDRGVMAVGVTEIGSIDGLAWKDGGGK